MSNCSIIPLVLNGKNEKVDSKLYKDLLSAFKNRSDATYWYLKTRTEDFLNNHLYKFHVDENNEPLLPDLIRKTSLKNILSEEEIVDDLKRKIGYYNKNGLPSLWLMNEDNYNKLIKNINNFNLNSHYNSMYRASLLKVSDSESHRIFYRPTILPILEDKKPSLNNISKEELSKQEKSLNDKIKKILSNSGISIGFIDILEKKQGINGVTDFSAKKNALGIIELIRLAQGIEGERVLPEEFAHATLESMINNPLVERLLKLLDNDALILKELGDSYKLYYTFYNGNLNLLAKEVAGKLIAKHFLKSEKIEENKTYKNLLQRLIESIKNIFKKISIDEIKSSIIEANNIASTLSKLILDSDRIDIEKINNVSLRLYSLDKKVSKEQEILLSIINNEIKRYKIYSSRSKNESFEKKLNELISLLKDNLEKNTHKVGIYTFISNSNKILTSLIDKLKNIDTNASNINHIASILRDSRDYLYSYKNIFKSIRQDLDNSDIDNEIKEILDASTILLEDIETIYNQRALPLFIKFMKPFMGDKLIVPYGKNKGKVYTIEDILNVAEKDISVFDMLLDSMADSSDNVIKGFDLVIKKAKSESRLDTLEIIKLIEYHHYKLVSNGINDTSFMYEIDNEGKRTGTYVIPININAYLKAKKEFIELLNLKYPLKNLKYLFRKEYKQWLKDNNEIKDGVYSPKPSIYGSELYRKIMANEAMKEYYNAMLSIKYELDKLLPEGTTKFFNTIKIRKDLVERIKSLKGAKGKYESIKIHLQDLFMRRSDDIDIQEKSTLINFENRKVLTLPIFYTKIKENESEEDISTDMTSTLMAYASMVNDYKHMNDIINILEVGRDLMRDNRKVMQTDGDTKLKEKIKILGYDINNPLFKRGDSTRFMKRLDDAFDMQVYNRYMKDEGTIFGKIDIAKGANALNKATSFFNQAFNILGNIANVTTGEAMLRIESFSKEFFSNENLIKGDKIYYSYIKESIGNMGKEIKVDKLSLFNELFNVTLDFDIKIKHRLFDRKRYMKLLGGEAPYFLLNAGEHWLHTRAALALADTIKLKDKSGKIYNLFEALDIVYNDSNNTEAGARLLVKPGLTKEDGTTFSKEDIIEFERKLAAINQSMHGIYNKEDRAAVQSLALGRLALMFRKWIKPAMNRRFKGLRYNFDLKEWREGYYVTAFNFMKLLTQNLRLGLFNILSSWDKLSSTEKANMRRAIFESSLFMSLVGLIALLDYTDDDKEDTVYKKHLEYQLKRLKSEIGVLVPSPMMLQEGLRILKYPAASISVVEKTIDLVNLLNPLNYETFNEEAIIQSGSFKGRSKAEKIILQSPLIPFRRNITRVVDPADAIKFYDL